MDVSPFRRRPGRDRSGDGRMPRARHRLDRPGRFSLARPWTVTGADARRIVEWPRLRPAAWSARRRTPHRGECHRLVGVRDIYRFGALTERQGARARPCPRSGPGDGGPECPHLSYQGPLILTREALPESPVHESMRSTFNSWSIGWLRYRLPGSTCRPANCV